MATTQLPDMLFMVSACCVFRRHNDPQVCSWFLRGVLLATTRHVVNGFCVVWFSIGPRTQKLVKVFCVALCWQRPNDPTCCYWFLRGVFPSSQGPSSLFMISALRFAVNDPAARDMLLMVSALCLFPSTQRPHKFSNGFRVVFCWQRPDDPKCC